MSLLWGARKHGDLKRIILWVAEETCENGASDVTYEDNGSSVNDIDKKGMVGGMTHP
jgi:hypothetical protein